jgi:Domain of unknown function (DUF5655)
VGTTTGNDRVDRPLWECPICGRTFANRNQTHTCSALGSLDGHFRDKSTKVRATFDAIVDSVTQFGPITILPEKSRIALHARMSFAAFMPRRDWLNGHLVLARRIESPRFSKIATVSPRNVLHAFRLNSPAEVDDEFIAWLGEAYEVGMQRHLDGKG